MCKSHRAVYLGRRDLRADRSLMGSCTFPKLPIPFIAQGSALLPPQLWCHPFWLKNHRPKREAVSDTHLMCVHHRRQETKLRSSDGEVVKCLGMAQTTQAEEEEEEDGEETSDKLEKVSGERGASDKGSRGGRRGRKDGTGGQGYGWGGGEGKGGF